MDANASKRPQTPYTSEEHDTFVAALGEYYVEALVLHPVHGVSASHIMEAFFSEELFLHAWSFKEAAEMPWAWVLPLVAPSWPEAFTIYEEVWTWSLCSSIVVRLKEGALASLEGPSLQKTVA